jgi:hypothetical protein
MRLPPSHSSHVYSGSNTSALKGIFADGQRLINRHIYKPHLLRCRSRSRSRSPHTPRLDVEKPLLDALA